MVKNWYVVHTYSGYEEKVKTSLEEKVEKKGFAEKISKVLVPTERVIELRGGKKRQTDKKFYPGYILVQMDLDDETWHFVRSTPKVTGFVGGANPIPLPQEELDIIIQQIEKGPTSQVRAQFNKGDSVRIIDGPFTNFIGFVDEVDLDHGKLRVMVSIFGRQTPVELNFLQVEKEKA